MERPHRAVVARVHRLQQVKGFRATYLAHDDAFRSHTEAILNEIAHRDLALSFKIGRTCLKSNHMRLLELKLRGVFTRNDAFSVID